jgi:hypothetical protein
MNYSTFYPNICHKAIKNMGLGSGKNLFRIQGQKCTGSGSETLIYQHCSIV